MKKKILSILLLSAIFFSGVYIGEAINEKKHEKDIIVTNPNLITFIKTWDIVQDNFVYSLTEDKQNKMKNAAIQAMLSSIDPHSAWWDSSSKDILSEKLKGEYGGIGIRYIFDDKNKNFKVISIKKDGPADKAGIKINDILYKVNSVFYKDPNFMDDFKGKIGSKVSLQIIRDKKVYNLEMLREKINNFSVYSKIIKISQNNWLNIRITDFQETTVNDIASEIRNNWYSNKNPNYGIILDLRGSPGGLVDVSSGVSSLFLQPNQKVTSINERNNNKIDFKTVNFPTESWTKWAKSVPLIIWVDDNTASAAEILASSLRDNGRTTFIIGSSTFGKGTVQRTFPINLKEQATFTIGFYKTPTNRYLQWKGVVPDVLFEYPLDFKNELKKYHEQSINESLQPPLKEKDIEAKIKLEISKEDIDNKTSDEIYLEKTELILNRHDF